MKTIKDLKRLIAEEISANTGLQNDMVFRTDWEKGEVSVYNGTVNGGKHLYVRDIADVQIAYWTIAKMGRTAIIDPAK